MKMTKKRKSQQDKLRRKFGWKISSMPSTGWTGLLKEKAEVYSHKRVSNDIAIAFNDLLLWHEVLGTNCGKGITIDISQYDDSTEKTKCLNNLSVTLTFEELETIYKIAKEKRYEAIGKHYGFIGDTIVKCKNCSKCEVLYRNLKRSEENEDAEN